MCIQRVTVMSFWGKYGKLKDLKQSYEQDIFTIV